MTMFKTQTNPADRQFFGMDLSLTGSAISCIHQQGNFLRSKVFPTKADKNFEPRADIIVTGIREFFHEYYSHGDIVFVENLAFGARGLGMLQLAGVHFIITYHLYKHWGIPFQRVQNTAWKKEIIGTGKANKDLILMKVYKKYGLEFTNSDEADAFCIAQYARKITPLVTPTLKPRTNA